MFRALFGHFLGKKKCPVEQKTARQKLKKCHLSKYLKKLFLVNLCSVFAIVVIFDPSTAKTSDINHGLLRSKRGMGVGGREGTDIAK